MRARCLFSSIVLSLSILLSGCGRKTPQPDNQAKTAAGNPDTVSALTVTGMQDSLHGPAMDKIAARSSLPLEGQPEALMDTTLVRKRAGALHLGMPVDSVYFAYGRKNVRETVEYVEGNPCPVLEIHLPGGTEDNPSLVAGIGETRDTVYGIEVFDSRFKTSRGIGSGSTFGELRKRYPVESVKQYEIGILVNVRELRMAFELDPSMVSIDHMGAEDPKRIPDNARIVRVIVGWEEGLE